MKPSLTIDRAALDGVARDLGLTLPVWAKVERIRDQRRPQAFIGGRYHGIDCFHRAHHLTVNPYQTEHAAMRSLVHELTHAVQCERWGSWHRFDAEYERQLSERGIRRTDEDFYQRYAAIPFEQEAIAAAENHTFGCILSDPSGRVVTG